MLETQVEELCGRIRRCELIGKGVSLAVYFEVSKAHIIPVCFVCLSVLPPSLCCMLLQHYACLLAAKTLTLCNHEHNVSPELNTVSYRALVMVFSHNTEQ